MKYTVIKHDSLSDSVMVDATFDDSWFDFQFSISCGVPDGSRGTQTSDFL